MNKELLRVGMAAAAGGYVNSMVKPHIVRIVGDKLPTNILDAASIGLSTAGAFWALGKVGI